MTDDRLLITRKTRIFGSLVLFKRIELIILVQSGKFKMKSAAHGTYLKALPSDNSYVEQTRDENELGTEWRIERIGVDVTRSYFGDFRFGDFVFNSTENKK